LERITHDVFLMRSNVQPLETFLLELDVAGLERAVVLPIDASTTKGCRIYSNAQIAELCRMSERFIGFASVDPHNPSAAEDLDHAVKELGLRGLKLSPSTQEFYPNDAERAYPLYERAQRLGIPVGS
jgi:predicted TIM-barrel fold metal-dependent hydrolase